MYRTKISSLKARKLSRKRKPLILLGARQVGKTWLIKEFGRTEYKQVAYINFENPDAPKELFSTDFDMQRIITVLNAYCNMRITPADTLIVFDEIQSAEKGITSLKYCYENAPQYHIITAGSLLGINLHEGESFPVGKVDFMQLRPMSYYEFLLAMHEDGMAALLKNKDMENLTFFREKFLNYLHYYLYVGGMPEAVEEFAENRDWRSVRHIQDEILMSYRNDFSKHAPAESVPRINMVWESIPNQLAKENKKFVYGIIKEGARAKDYELAIQWLTDAGLLHKVYNVSKPALPLSAYKELSAFKLYHNDVGLLGAMSHLSAKTIVTGNDVFTEFKGALAEQYVFQQLMQQESMVIKYFTFCNSKYEIDFLIQNEDDEIIPIEVKAGENLKANSFKLFCNKYHPVKAIRTSVADYRQEDNLQNIPLFAI